jgi:hypothetical protein
MKTHVLMWYLSFVVVVALAIGLLGGAGPWLISQPDSLTVLIGVLVYLVGIPAVGFAGWTLVQSILAYHKQINTKEVE